MATCSRSFTLTVSDDMPLDAATYVPSTGKIVGVRGGYLFSFNATTGAKESSARFATPVFSGSCIAYEPVSNRLVVGCWNEWHEWIGSAALVPGKGLYNVNPASFAVISHNVSFPLDFPFGDLELTALPDGVHSLFASGGTVYGLVQSNNVSGGRGGLLWFNPGTDSLISVGGGQYSSNQGQPGSLVVTTNGIVIPSAFSRMRIYDKAAPTATPLFDVNYPALVPDTDSSGLSGVVADGSENLYWIDRSDAIIKTAPDLTGGVRLSVGDAAARYFGIAYNSNDGYIYLANPLGNTVAVWNPATDTLVAIKTGFDSPHGFVFSPTAKFAVQHSTSGLKLIT